VRLFDFGTGGLDLAYEVMRGYDALVLIDISQQGEPPGTLYVMEPDPAEVEGGIEDGETINPHAMDPQTVLRFVKTVGGWPGKVVVIACEPTAIGEMAWGLSEAVQEAVSRAVDVVLKTVEHLRTDAAYAES
jgi:hydrogenase maturation protease